jgi:23S rRNA (uracil1939-C5)-methyltransferase
VAPERENSLLPRAMAEPLEEVSVVALDAHGHGVGANGAIVPNALPGERMLVKFEGKRVELIETLDPSPERAEPICPWFGRCGGCVAQHMSASLYHAWKRSVVVEALEREGVSAKVEELVDAHGAGRRRATFHARFPHGQPDEVGFMRARSHDIIAIDACPLFSPGMAGAIPSARALSGNLRGLMKPLDISVTATLDGLDVDLRGSGPLGRGEAQKLARTADKLDLARVSNHGQTVIEPRPPRVAFGEALAKLPPGGFLQATEAGEAWLAQFAERALADTKRVADLFCGAGAFALRLAKGREVFAADADPAAISALARAASATPGLHKLTADTRDLFRRPLQAHELTAFDAALIDPPRAGAIEQARALAASALPLVVSISCNAATFARDARILIDGGFQVESLTPLDQFRFSAHVEIAAVFRRPRPKARARRLL